jgi:hypothetical protein
MGLRQRILSWIGHRGCPVNFYDYSDPKLSLPQALEFYKMLPIYVHCKTTVTVSAGVDEDSRPITINGSPSLVMRPGEVRCFMTDGKNWYS